MFILPTLLLIAGLLHIPAAKERLKVSPQIGYAYIFAGLIQIILGVLFTVHPLAWLKLFTIILNAAYLLIWIISESPLSKNLAAPEPLRFIVIMRKLIEISIVLILLVSH